MVGALNACAAKDVSLHVTAPVNRLAASVPAPHVDWVALVCSARVRSRAAPAWSVRTCPSSASRYVHSRNWTNNYQTTVYKNLLL